MSDAPVARPGAKHLSADRIVDAAQAMIETDGFGALSMRKLADRLGVSAMTLYRYFATKAELQSALADRLLDELERPAAGLAWDAELAAIFRSVHDLCLRHPELAEILARQHLNVSAADRGGERVLGALRRAGLDAETAVAAFHALASYTTGFALRRAHLDADPAIGAQRAARLRSLPAEEFTHFHELAAVYVGGLSDRQFDIGLDLLIRGIATKGST